MNILPWRVRAFIRNNAPLAYHLIANLNTPRRSEGYWNARLVESWDLRNWPVKDALIESLTSPEHPPLDTCGNFGILKYLKADGYQHLRGWRSRNTR